MNIRRMTQDELEQWHRILRTTRDNRVAMTIICLFGGERLSCCDEAVCVEEDGKVVSVASISPEGEQQNGKPAIVGLYTLPPYRRRGYGLVAMKAAIERMVERGLTPIHVDILSKGAKHLILKLPDALRRYLEVDDYSGFIATDLVLS